MAMAPASRRAKRQLEKVKQNKITDTTKVLRAVGYVRVSTDEQTEKYGPELQKEAITNFAKSQDYQLVTIIEDSISGGTEPKNRPGFRQILGMAVAKKFDILLVWKFDRLARHLVYAVVTVNELQELGIVIKSVTEPIDTSTAMGQTMFSILAGMAAQERENIKERTRGGRIKKAEHGGYACGGIPLGYRKTDDGLAVDENEAEAIKRIFQLRQEGKTLRAIAQTLTDEGFRTKKGGRWYASTVQYILDNPKYSGQVEYVFTSIGKHILSEGTHEPIIDRPLAV